MNVQNFKSRKEAREFAHYNQGKVVDDRCGVSESWQVVFPASQPVVAEKIIMYKLVTQQMTTQNDTKWAIGVTNKAKLSGNKMCSGAVLHCYSDPLLAALFNPIHADIENPVLLKIECSEIINSDGLKHACKEQTPLEIVTLPVISINQYVAFGIKCALKVCKDSKFIFWANKWLSGEDRSANAAYAAAYAAANAAAYAAANAAANAVIDFKAIIEWVLNNIT